MWATNWPTYLGAPLRPAVCLAHARRVQARSDYRAPQGIASASTDGIYAAMDWLGRPDLIEVKLAAPAPGAYVGSNPAPAKTAAAKRTSRWLFSFHRVRLASVFK
jgi:hypothetical protein